MKAIFKHLPLTLVTVALFAFNFYRVIEELTK